MKLRIKEVREKAGLTQREAAEKVGISQPYFAQVERGLRRLDAALQGRIGQSLGVHPSELVDYNAPEEGDEEFLIERFRDLSAEERAIWLNFARSFAAKAKKRKR
jgi:transcriptional regulator with XRE-family HTH domain